jgi:hypothetical protein
MTNEEKLKLKFEFYKLRAIDGKSFNQISGEMGVSKPTLIKWEKESLGTLGEIKASEIQNLISEHSYCIKTRLSELIELSKKLSLEISQRDMSTYPISKLIEIYLDINEQIERIECNNKLMPSDIYHITNDKYFTETLPDKILP